MANNCKQCFNTHYQPHCHPTTKSLWLCSSVYCGPPHPSRRIMVGGRSRQPKSTKIFIGCNFANQLTWNNTRFEWLYLIWNEYIQNCFSGRWRQQSKDTYCTFFHCKFYSICTLLCSVWGENTFLLHFGIQFLNTASDFRFSFGKWFGYKRP